MSIYVCVCVLDLFTLSLVSGHLVYFNFLTIMRNAAKNRYFVYKFVCEGVFSFLLSGHIGVKYLAHMVNNFWSNFQCFLSRVAVPLYITSSVSTSSWTLAIVHILLLLLVLHCISYKTTWPASWETCMQVRKQQLELDMEQQTGSK